MSKRIGIVACSDALPRTQSAHIQKVCDALYEQGYATTLSPYIYSDEQPTVQRAQLKAEVLMAFYSQPDMDAIMDVSGGDLANEVLPCLDFERIGASQAVFYGYSDLTTLLNSIYTCTGKHSVLYQVKKSTTSDISEAIFDFDYHFIQGDMLEGVVVGGNIRCFLKLAGTPYWPDMTDKILLLESFGGKVSQMCTYLNQLEQIGVFKQIKGVLLGQFTEMEKEGYEPTIEALVGQKLTANQALVKTRQIGHSQDARAIRIGAPLTLRR